MQHKLSIAFATSLPTSRGKLVQGWLSSNDLKVVRSKDDVLTVLIHLGYLSYDRDSATCRIPNREIAIEFKNAKRYAVSLQDYVGEVVLVGIDYDKKTKQHKCKIERINKG